MTGTKIGKAFKKEKICLKRGINSQLLTPLFFLFFASGCTDEMEVKFLNPASFYSDNSAVVNASDICSGIVIAGVTGTANCSGVGASVSMAEAFYLTSSRKDIASFDWTAGSGDMLALISGSSDRSESLLTWQALYDENDLLTSFKSKYQLMPNPITDSDGRCGDDDPLCGTDGADGIGKKHYLERITGRPNQECGTNAIVGSSASISDRVADCAVKNGAKAFYIGAQYGQDGEGDWKLVTRLSTGEEVWQDQRTKLLWSDQAVSSYNWYQAAGYSKATAISKAETSYDSAPNSGTDCGGSACQPAQPISVCAEVSNGQLIDQSGIQSNYQANPENAFKGNLKASEGVIWKLPSRYDFLQAEVNGIRKVLPNLQYSLWSSSSVSHRRYNSWLFGGFGGDIYALNRLNGASVRCVGLDVSMRP